MPKSLKIAHVNVQCDPAGVSWLLHKALEKKGYQSRHMLGKFGYRSGVVQGSDMSLVEQRDETDKVLKEADILHISNSLRGWKYPDRYDIPQININNYLKLGKPFIMHNHGGVTLLDPYNAQINELKCHKQNWAYVVCSPLTQYLIPESVWMPNIMPIEQNMYLPTPRDFTGPLKVCHKIHSSTVRCFKGTDVLIDCFDRLEGYATKFKVFEELSIQECMRQSAEYHVCVDNLTQGFIGMSGWESLSKGQVVIARLDPWVEESYKRLGGGRCPIINVTGMDEMCKVIRELHNDRQYLENWGKYSRKWMEENYNEEKIVQYYIKLYNKVLNGDITFDNTKNDIKRKKVGNLMV